MPIATVGDIDVYYELAGAGPRLLFISGTGGDLRVRPNVFDGPLTQRFQVLGYDQRGLGQTSKPPGGYSMRQYADDAARLLDHLGWEQVPVIGVSFGGMVAQEFALTHGDRISCLVLACTSAGGDGGASFPLHTLAQLPAEARLVRQLELSDTRRDATWRAANPDRFAALLDMARAGAAARPTDAQSEHGARAQLEARAAHDTWRRLPALKMPVLVAGGHFDGIAPPDNLAAMTSRIPQAELMMFDGGHLFLIQDKAAYPAIIDWVSGHL
jgi:3-oxoadipate enol-lactonase